YYFSSHIDRSLLAVAQFLAVAARPGWDFFGGARILNTYWASSLVPKPPGVCRNSAGGRPAAGPANCTVSRLPLAAAALSAAEIRSSRSCGGEPFRKT